MDQGVEKYLSPFVVTLGDGKTRVARKYAVNVFADVIAILGLKRISEFSKARNKKPARWGGGKTERRLLRLLLRWQHGRHEE